jgi:hypothetical protein
MKQFLLVFGIALIISLPVQGQDDLMALIETTEAPTYVTSTFKGTRLINGHSVETRNQGVLEFIISHRFGPVNSGSYDLWGLDQANIRLGLEHALTDRLFVGVGRSSFEKTFDGFLKYQVLKQKSSQGSPVTITYFGSGAYRNLQIPGIEFSTNDKIGITQQLLIARKFGPDLSLQLMPTLVRLTEVDPLADAENIASLGMGGRYKINQWLSINAEYYHNFSSIDDDFYNALAVGVDLDTGGHIFQLHFTNSRAMIEKGFIGETRDDFFDGGIRFGFNVNRTFQLYNR